MELLSLQSIGSPIVLLCFLLGGFFIVVITIYNGLVAKRNMVRNTFSSIDVNLKKRSELIPNLVETVKSYAQHEQEVLVSAIELRNKLNHASSQQERMKLEGAVSPAVNKLFGLAESYPDLKSHENFLNLQRTLTEIEEQISASRRAYNAAVMAQNNAVESFPSNIIANVFAFKPHEFFEIPESERFNPEVNF